MPKFEPITLCGVTLKPELDGDLYVWWKARIGPILVLVMTRQAQQNSWYSQVLSTEDLLVQAIASAEHGLDIATPEFRYSRFSTQAQALEDTEKAITERLHRWISETDNIKAALKYINKS